MDKVAYMGHISVLIDPKATAEEKDEAARWIVTWGNASHKHTAISTLSLLATRLIEEKAATAGADSDNILRLYLATIETNTEEVRSHDH